MGEFRKPAAGARSAELLFNEAEVLATIGADPSGDRRALEESEGGS